MTMNVPPSRTWRRRIRLQTLAAVVFSVAACTPVADLVEPNAEIHVTGRVVDGADSGIANASITVIAYEGCGATVGTLGETVTRQDGAFGVVLRTMIGTTVCLKVRAVPPGHRPDLRPDSVVDVPAVFRYQPPYDALRIDVRLGPMPTPRP